jgi:glycosyl transferase, family 25
MIYGKFITYIVNLKKHKQRKKSIIKQIKKQGIKNYKIVEAVNGHQLKPKELNSKIFKNNRGLNKWNSKLQPGQVGCALSHLKIYKLFLKSKYETALVLEDDAIFIRNFSKNLKIFILSNFTKKSQITLLSEIKEFYKKPIARLKLFSLVNVTNAFFTHSYFINKDAARKLLKFNYPVKTIADNFVYFKIYCKINLLGINPYITIQDKRNFATSIGYQKNLTNKRGFLLKYKIYKIKNLIKKKILSCFNGHS